jgi:acyl dehydratase
VDGGVAPGTALPPLTVHLARADLVRYAGASGDLNPIHWDEHFARSVGLPDVIAHGMLTMGLAVRAVTAWVGDPGAVLDYRTKFTRPVVVAHDTGADVEVSGVVAQVGDDGTARIDLTVTSAGAKVLGAARVVVRLPAGDAPADA